MNIPSVSCPYLNCPLSFPPLSEKLILPDFNKSSNARIRVKATDNIFYSINAADFTILDPSFKLNLVNPPTTKCFDETTEISIDPTGGAGAPYSVLWEKLNEDNQWVEVKDLDNNPKLLSKISPGNYKVSVSDKDSNSYVSPVVIANGPKEKLKIETSFSNIELSCFGDNNGKVEINPSGGVFPYTLLLNDKVVTSGLKINEIYAINDLTVGSFTLQLIDANGCLSELTNFEITQPQSKINLKSFAIENAKNEDDAEDVAYDELDKLRSRRKFGPGGGGGLDEFEATEVNKTTSTLGLKSARREGP